MTLGSDIKDFYEDRSKFLLTRHVPVILRLDGKAFHTLTKSCEKPFDHNLADCLNKAAVRLCSEIMGAQCAYLQSDEISILVTDYKNFDTESWFNYNVAKICSVSSSIVSVEFSKNFGKDGFFDCRAFNVPKEMVSKVFAWRQMDWARNSLSMFAREYFSAKELHKKKETKFMKCFIPKDKTGLT